jgi:putative redox protein
MSASKFPKFPYSLHGEGRGVAHTIHQDGTSHVIRVDAPASFGGKDEYPGPVSYTLGALISCSQVTAQVVAKDLGIQVGSFEFDLRAVLDTAVLVGGVRDDKVGIQDVKISAKVEARATPELFAELREETERRCPIFQLFKKSGVSIESRWTQTAL